MNDKMRSLNESHRHRGLGRGRSVSVRAWGQELGLTGRLTDGRHLSGAWGGKNAQKKPGKERGTKGNIPEMCAC